MVHSLKACWRLLHAVGHALGGWWTIRFTFPGLSQAERNAQVQEWSRRMLEIMGITLKVQGTPPPEGPVLLICNHLSWLDITCIHAARHVRFVSKSDVKGWPLIGTLSTGSGTLYIERERRRDALRVVHHMTEALLVETRLHGMSRTLGQPIPGIDAFCAPVFDSTNNLVLGITAMGPEATFDREWEGRVAAPLKACALEISRRLGFVPTGEQA